MSVVILTRQSLSLACWRVADCGKIRGRAIHQDSLPLPLIQIHRTQTASMVVLPAAPLSFRPVKAPPRNAER